MLMVMVKLINVMHNTFCKKEKKNPLREKVTKAVK